MEMSQGKKAFKLVSLVALDPQTRKPACGKGQYPPRGFSVLTGAKLKKLKIRKAEPVKRVLHWLLGTPLARSSDKSLC